MELMTKEIERKFEKYPVGSQDGLGLDAKVLVKYFNPIGAGTWLIIEGDKLKNGEFEMFGYVDLGDSNNAEYGYVYLSELESIKLPGGLKIERDLHLPEDCTLLEAMQRSGIEPPEYMLDKNKDDYEY